MYLKTHKCLLNTKNVSFLLSIKINSCSLSSLTTLITHSQRPDTAPTKRCMFQLCATNIGLVQVKDMQTPPLKKRKEPSLLFGPNCCTMFWNKWKLNFPILFELLMILFTIFNCFYRPKTCSTEKKFSKLAQFCELDFCIHEIFLCDS